MRFTHGALARPVSDKLAGKTILVVDDWPLVREFLVTILGHAGYRVLEACDGDAALALMKAEAPDLVIADLVMPHMDGFEFVHLMRAEPGTADIPVIVYTSAYSAAEVEALGEQCGIFRVLAKPADNRLILQAVAEGLAANPAHASSLSTTDGFQKQHVRILTEKLAQKVNQLESSDWRLAGLLSLGPQLVEERDRSRILEKFCRVAVGILEAEHVAVVLGDGFGVNAFLHSAEEDAEHALRTIRLAAGQLPLGHRLQEGRPLRLAALGDEARYLGLPLSGAETRPLLAMSLGWGSGLPGGLYFIGRQGQSEFRPDNERVCAALAALLAMSLSNGEQFRQLQEYTASREAAVEEERARIAREIHDELGQALTGLKMDLYWLQNRLAVEAPSERHLLMLSRSGEMVRLIDTTIRTVRRIATELRPPVLDDLGLVAAIDWLAQDFQTRTGIRCRLQATPGDLPLERERALALFRIFQEALTNVARHAEAKDVEVVLRPEKDHLLLEIRDNGKGISEDAIRQRGALGLLGMRERAAFLGGIVQIDRSPEGGTRVAARIPLKP